MESWNVEVDPDWGWEYPNGLPDMAPYEFYTEEMADRALSAYRAILEAIREVRDLS